MRKPMIDKKIFQERWGRLRDMAKGSAIILPSHPHFIRNNDVHYEYRQDSNLFYLTGFEEPDSVFVLRPGMSPESILFVRPRDPSKETWDGFIWGPDRTKAEFGVDATFEIGAFRKELPQLIKDVEKVYYKMFFNPEMDRLMGEILTDVRSKTGRSGLGILPIHDPSELLGEMRVFKSPDEQDWLRKACEMTANAHVQAMKHTKPGVTENEIEGVVLQSFFKQGSQRFGYKSIVATGSNAVTLHYNFNDETCKDGDLLLIDAGCEWKYLSSDITRTFPVNGKFSDPQRKLYEATLHVQKTLVDFVKPGITYDSILEKNASLMVEVQTDLGLLKESKEKALKESLWRKYMPHGFGHFLGLDVHDAGLYKKHGKSRELEPGMVFTVEPGLYVREDDMDAPAEFRGIGIRIEDDILVTDKGRENMTASAPKEINEIENLVGQST